MKLKRRVIAIMIILRNTVTGALRIQRKANMILRLQNSTNLWRSIHRQRLINNRGVTHSKKGDLGHAYKTILNNSCES